MKIYVTACLVLIVWLWLCLMMSPEGAIWAIGMNWFLLAIFGDGGGDDALKGTYEMWLGGFFLLVVLFITHIIDLTWVMLLGYTMTMATNLVKNVFGWKSWFLPYGIFEFFTGKELEPIKMIDRDQLPSVDPVTVAFAIVLLAIFNW